MEHLKKNRHSSFVNFLIILLVLGEITEIIAAMYLYKSSDYSLMTSSRTLDSEEVCNTDDCKFVAKRLKGMMNFSVNPCDDFYQFTCGKFLKRDIPAHVGSVSEFAILKSIVFRRIQNSLETKVDESDPKFIVHAKNLYSSCKNNDVRETNGLKFLQNLLKKLNGWPVLLGERWSQEDTFNWIDLLGQLIEEGLNINYLFSINIGVNLHKTTQKMIEIDAPKTLINGRIMQNNFKTLPQIIAYHTAMSDVAVLLGADRQAIKDEIWEVVLFEGALAKSKYLKKNSEDFTFWTLKELREKSNDISWKDFFNNYFKNSSIVISDDEPISILNEGFIEKASGLITSAPKRVVANYLIWRTIFEIIGDLPDKFVNVYLKYIKETTGVVVTMHPWSRCISSISKLYTLALSYLYVKEYFDIDAKLEAEKIVTDIKKQMTRSLIWLDESSRKEAIKKLNDMRAGVGFPSELLDEKKLQQFYGEFESGPDDNYLQNQMMVKKHLNMMELESFRTPLDKSDWKRHAEVTNVNALYSIIDNAIYVPAAVLQGALFGEDRPRYLNYGGIGFIIGHEMTHAYDIQGSLFDYAGNMRDWWTNSSKESYFQRASCVTKQYGNFRVEQINKMVNGQTTASENLADIGGLDAAYGAYLANKFIDPILPDFQQFNNRHMFWISAASVWCETARDEVLDFLVTNGVHAPAEFRVNGAFSNLDAFAQDFNCPVGSPMNPETKCSIWKQNF